MQTSESPGRLKRDDWRNRAPCRSAFPGSTGSSLRKRRGWPSGSRTFAGTSLHPKPRQRRAIRPVLLEHLNINRNPRPSMEPAGSRPCLFQISFPVYKNDHWIEASRGHEDLRSLAQLRRSAAPTSAGPNARPIPAPRNPGSTPPIVFTKRSSEPLPATEAFRSRSKSDPQEIPLPRASKNGPGIEKSLAYTLSSKAVSFPGCTLSVLSYCLPM
ncbi:hypothetical protein MAMC_02179 [Methylacidimicrobium cyclopophantes]|uniref:Uncharacterized protein n=1 Tax=Methylacidimicrobium cyclopophantes TaxID=1041766 RepID=A0A5E6MHG5_9BACT|nr:hypothetical protein MAMC_02179 [Methylacidimicrobium cyclopophantes]